MLFSLRVIDRLYKYLEFHHISPHAFERTCGVANGYIKKQLNGRGTIGSEIIEKIIDTYSDLSLTWLITGEGKMLLYEQKSESMGKMHESAPDYLSSIFIGRQLKEKIKVLENALADKEKIIKLLEKQLCKNEQS
ncbi:MAG: hypothetical protein ABI415_03070 [Flavitalea sp.]